MCVCVSETGKHLCQCIDNPRTRTKTTTTTVAVASAVKGIRGRKEELQPELEKGDPEPEPDPERAQSSAFCIYSHALLSINLISRSQFTALNSRLPGSTLRRAGAGAGQWRKDLTSCQEYPPPPS